MTNAAIDIHRANRLAVRNKLDALEDLMHAGIASGDLEQTHHDATTDEGHEEADHLFAGGLYARTLTIPAGCVVVGRIHHQDRICIISKGRCSFADESGHKTVSAPYIAKFQKGMKTAVYAYEDTVWTAIVATDIEDDREAVAELSSASHEDYRLITETSAKLLDRGHD